MNARMVANALRLLADAIEAPDVEASPVDVRVTIDTIEKYVPGLTPRAFADGCREGRWPSFRAGRKRMAKLADILAAIDAKPARTRPPRKVAPPDEEAAEDMRLLAAAGVRLTKPIEPPPTATAGVYFIQQQDKGPIKIGMAKSIRARIDGLQTASPVPLRFLGYVDGGRQKEVELHQRFAVHRKSGEWFEPAAELLDFIEREAIDILLEDAGLARCAGEQFGLEFKPGRAGA
jgi:hypothetical protein